MFQGDYLKHKNSSHLLWQMTKYKWSLRPCSSLYRPSLLIEGSPSTLGFELEPITIDVLIENVKGVTCFGLTASTDTDKCAPVGAMPQSKRIKSLLESSLLCVAKNANLLGNEPNDDYVQINLREWCI